ncbi:GRRM system radical SAM/SPASM domain protein [Scytonema hofmannii FACHB-248]|uniref:GRRM system radical SAM/SPASM domain protein n=1 Tax=Scytonema hofmannii FACHB-248 TaxID=1842502 RepID=A0ABR8GQN8_9CYAN|nr:MULTISPECIES: cyclophane-forming radical SAM/SPASM peptide maturase GrrM/OscB [Nostocales]MBD2605271.1 GRRM system radical SAM/SPASM domain protein [Scytonema hofmannii FACHB-248]
MDFKTNLVVIQSTPLCNIDCRYCYLPDRSEKKRLSMETLQRIAESFFDSPYVSNEEITFLWHAGEPLAVPPDFYEEAFEIVRRANINNAEVVHTFQTNATLINQKWCDLIKRWNVRIGVSVDGPKYIHDANRVDKAGKGTFDSVIRGIDILHKHDIPITTITVVTKNSVEKPDELWRFFVKNNIRSIAFNPEEVDGCNKFSTLNEDDSAKRYKAFLERIAFLRDTEKPDMLIREADAFTERITQSHDLAYSMLNNPFCTLSFDCEGNVSTFCPELLTSRNERFGDFTFGNVWNSSLEDIFSQSQKFQKIYSEIELGKQKCKETCEYFSVCGGGNPSNKFSETTRFDVTETEYCRIAVKATCDAMLNHLERKLAVS